MQHDLYGAYSAQLLFLWRQYKQKKKHSREQWMTCLQIKMNWCFQHCHSTQRLPVHQPASAGQWTNSWRPKMQLVGKSGLLVSALSIIEPQNCAALLVNRNRHRIRIYFPWFWWNWGIFKTFSSQENPNALPSLPSFSSHGIQPKL